MTELRKLLLSKLRPNPKQPRTEYDEDEMELLAADIARGGQQVAIIAEPIPGTDEFMILDGHRRWIAMKTLELKECWVEVREGLTDKQRSLLLLSVLKRSDITPLEHGLYVLEVLKETGWSQKRYCREASEDESKVSRDLALVKNLHEELAPAVREGRLSPRAAYLLATKLRTKRDEQLTAARKVMDERLTVEQLAALLSGKKAKAKSVVMKAKGIKITLCGATSKEEMIAALTDALAQLRR